MEKQGKQQDAEREQLAKSKSLVKNKCDCRHNQLVLD